MILDNPARKIAAYFSLNHTDERTEIQKSLGDLHELIALGLEPEYNLPERWNESADIIDH